MASKRTLTEHYKLKEHCRPKDGADSDKYYSKSIPVKDAFKFDLCTYVCSWKDQLNEHIKSKPLPTHSGSLYFPNHPWLTLLKIGDEESDL